DVTRIAPGMLDTTLSSLMRECLLTDAIPVIAEIDELTAKEGEINTDLRTLARAIETAPGPIAVTSRMTGMDLGVSDRRLLRVRWPVPATASRRELWTRALGDDLDAIGSADLDMLSLRYR